MAYFQSLIAACLGLDSKTESRAAHPTYSTQEVPTRTEYSSVAPPQYPPNPDLNKNSAIVSELTTRHGLTKCPNKLEPCPKGPLTILRYWASDDSLSDRSPHIIACVEGGEGSHVKTSMPVKKYQTADHAREMAGEEWSRIARSKGHRWRRKLGSSPRLSLWTTTIRYYIGV
ncbi:hypothetical protein BGW36DRAFT_431174 [Talaromyces proteolyticus]|uniref:Uncharacterized protein n=1 Tax=Talaromyces proteolyticus TaxID=1131652 RepID=A0AAD4PU74_9EURO|nr:uncharacterized protein BGW36DRAFT_431174 [Talaromyces proteolyticus]KAH8691930.1 hypothetical protein BGW36DRAFT_431174 [Talaromyces proteolyticus]